MLPKPLLVKAFVTAIGQGMLELYTEGFTIMEIMHEYWQQLDFYWSYAEASNRRKTAIQA